MFDTAPKEVTEITLAHESDAVREFYGAMRCASFTARCRARCWWAWKQPAPRFTPHRERASGKAPALNQAGTWPVNAVEFFTCNFTCKRSRLGVLTRT